MITNESFSAVERAVPTRSLVHIDRFLRSIFQFEYLNFGWLYMWIWKSMYRSLYWRELKSYYDGAFMLIATLIFIKSRLVCHLWFGKTFIREELDMPFLQLLSLHATPTKCNIILYPHDAYQRLSELRELTLLIWDFFMVEETRLVSAVCLIYNNDIELRNSHGAKTFHCPCRHLKMLIIFDFLDRQIDQWRLIYQS